MLKYVSHYCNKNGQFILLCPSGAHNENTHTLINIVSILSSLSLPLLSTLDAAASPRQPSHIHRSTVGRLHSTPFEYSFSPPFRLLFSYFGMKNDVEKEKNAFIVCLRPFFRSVILRCILDKCFGYFIQHHLSFCSPFSARRPGFRLMGNAKREMPYLHEILLSRANEERKHGFRPRQSEMKPQHFRSIARARTIRIGNTFFGERKPLRRFPSISLHSTWCRY